MEQQLIENNRYMTRLLMIGTTWPYPPLGSDNPCPRMERGHGSWNNTVYTETVKKVYMKFFLPLFNHEVLIIRCVHESN